MRFFTGKGGRAVGFIFTSLVELGATIYMLGWFIWPFLFIYALAHGLKDYLQGGENPPTGNLALASFCLMLMMCVVMVGTQ